jgi:hypothetical protein
MVCNRRVTDMKDGARSRAGVGLKEDKSIEEVEGLWSAVSSTAEWSEEVGG